jgi:hypothetical protein
MHLSIKNIKDEAAAIVFFLMVMIIQSHFIWGQQKEGFFHLDEILQLALVNAPELKLSNSDLRESQLSLKSLQKGSNPRSFSMVRCRGFLVRLSPLLYQTVETPLSTNRVCSIVWVCE